MRCQPVSRPHAAGRSGGGTPHRHLHDAPRGTSTPTTARRRASSLTASRPSAARRASAVLRMNYIAFQCDQRRRPERKSLVLGSTYFAWNSGAGNMLTRASPNRPRRRACSWCRLSRRCSGHPRTAFRSVPTRTRWVRTAITCGPSASPRSIRSIPRCSSSPFNLLHEIASRVASSPPSGHRNPRQRQDRDVLHGRSGRLERRDEVGLLAMGLAAVQERHGEPRPCVAGRHGVQLAESATDRMGDGSTGGARRRGTSGVRAETSCERTTQTGSTTYRADLPSEVPGTNIEWQSETPYNLLGTMATIPICSPTKPGSSYRKA